MIASKVEIGGEAVASHYDELDSFYREVWGSHVHHGYYENGQETVDEATERLVTEIARLLHPTPGARLCDVGCGYGETSLSLERRFGVVPTGLTISRAQFEVATASANASGSHATFVHGDWLENDLPSESFDLLIAIESSEHMGDKPRFFSEAFRVLKPGGRIVVAAWLSSENPTPMHERWLLEPICREGRMPQMGRPSEYARMMTEAGFQLNAVEDLSERVAPTWRIIAQRFAWSLVRDPRYLRFLLNQHARNRVFALTVFRIWFAYACGAMRYALFAGERKAQP